MIINEHVPSRLWLLKSISLCPLCPLATCSSAWSFFLLNTNHKPPNVQSLCKVHVRPPIEQIEQFKCREQWLRAQRLLTFYSLPFQSTDPFFPRFYYVRINKFGPDGGKAFAEVFETNTKMMILESHEIYRFFFLKLKFRYLSFLQTKKKKTTALN